MLLLNNSPILSSGMRDGWNLPLCTSRAYIFTSSFRIRNYYSLTMIYITQVFITLNERMYDGGEELRHTGAHLGRRTVICKGDGIFNMFK